MENKYSIWQKNKEKRAEFESLQEDKKADVCIIGGGLTGISCAYYLIQEGYKVVLLEKDQIASKTSGRTTGKITSQHHLFYNYLIQSQGKDFAKKYLKANEKAIENIESIIKKEKIDCNFERKSAFVFTKDLRKLQDIKDEVDAVKSLGKKVNFTKKIEVLGGVEGAIEFEEQAQFNPVKYVEGLAKCITEKQGEIFENTKVIECSKNGEDYIIKAIVQGRTRKVQAKYVVVCTRYPIFNVPGFYFVKMYQELEYGIAIKVDVNLNGMYISSEAPTISFRGYEENGEKYVLLVGNGHKTGEKAENNGFEYLENFARKYFPEREIVYCWNAEDSVGLDKIPYIGMYSEVRKNMYVATGFKKWGMTTSNVAANIIVDRILGKINPYEEIFNSTRLEPLKNHEEMKNMLEETYESMIVPKITGDETNPYCAHLGCQLSWNEVTKTWDCPCHGSRYEKDGKLIEGPAIYDIEI